MGIKNLAEKVLRTIIPQQTSLEIFREQTKKLGIYDSESEKEIYLTGNNSSELVCLRKRGSDLDLFKHMYWLREYEGLEAVVKNNQVDVNNVIDAGANIGLFSLHLKKLFPDALYTCIEPDAGNFAQLQKNIGSQRNVFLLRAGVWHQSASLKTANTFRDGLDWAISVEETGEHEQGIPGYTIKQIMDAQHIAEISILKIDVEGAERFLFGKDADISYLDKTRVVLIEIHDEFDIRETIYNKLIGHGFALYQNRHGLDIAVKPKKAG